jgi:uncharacterized protein YjbI with pentapeptide repeats
MSSNLNLRKVNFRSPIVLIAIGVIVTIVLAAAVVTILLRTGGTQALPKNAALIAAVVALGGVFTTQMVSVALEARRTREVALQNYLENVSKLLIEQPLRRASPGDNLSTVVRAQTLTVLMGLDPDRKGILLQFLYESGLLHRDKLAINLIFANLSKADLRESNLRESILRGVNLGNANLFAADLSRADLREADLRTSKLGKAVLGNANLFAADLSRADLSEAALLRANLFASNLSRTKLSRAKLNIADLGKANLRKADLRNADLGEADLVEADLSYANLDGAIGITNEDLQQRAQSLEGATMPNGQKYEKWLKDKEGRKEDTSPS